MATAAYSKAFVNYNGWVDVSGMFSGTRTSLAIQPALAVDYNLSNARSLIQLSLNLRFWNDGPTGAGTARVYLYTSNPISGTVYPSDVPGGYIATADAGSFEANTTNGRRSFWNRTVTFSSLNLSSAGTLYVMVKATTTSKPAGTGDFFVGFYWACDNYNYTTITVPTLAAVFKGMPTSFSVSPSTVSTGGKVSVNIGNFWTTETVQFYYGSTLLGSSTISNGAGQVTIPKSWFTTAGITTSQTMTVTAKLSGTSLAQNFTVQAGGDMKPTVTTPAISIVQDPSASDFPSTYIANISKAKAAVTVGTGSNAGISSVRLTWSGGTVDMTYNSSTQKYEATVGPLTGNTTFTVVVTDARGMTQQASYNLTGVVAYMAPVITINGTYTYRCDSEGLKEDGGEYVRALATAAISTEGLSGNSIQSFRFYIQEEPAKGTDLQDGVQSAATIGRTFDFYETLVFEVSDRIMTVTKSLRLPPGTRNFTMKRSADGTYVGIGVLPQHTSGPSTVDIEEGGGYYEGGFLWGSITRLNSYATDGSQFAKNFLQIDTDLLNASCHADAFFNMASTSGWSNYPVSSTPFKGYRKVVYINSSNIFVVILEAAPTVGRIWVNYYNGSTWSGWKNHAPA